MKILRLHLKAYGPFTDKQLDLSDGAHGLHIVYGVNEAGKSSSLRAVTDLLYGIPTRTPDNFVHPYPKLRIGAQLKHSDGALLEVVRRKASKKQLFDGEDSTPLDGDVLKKYLGDVDRDLFLMMFGIDHERLRQGGEEIVRGGGRIGELLFSAGAGISDLQSAQKQLNQEIDALLKTSGRSGTIVEGIKEYKNQREAMKQALVSADTWKQHDDNLQVANSRKTFLDEKIHEHQAERNRLVRIRDATTAIGKWKTAKHELSAVADIPLLPEDFEQQSSDLLVALHKAEQRKQDAEKSLAERKQELAGLIVPDKVLLEAEAIEAIRDRLGGHRKAMADRPKLETKLEEAENGAKAILRELGRAPDLLLVEELRLPNDKAVRIQNLGNQQEVLIERARSTRRDCDKIQSSISRLEQQLDANEISPDVEFLRSKLEEIRSGGDWGGRLQSLEDDLEELGENARMDLKQLGLWSGDLEELEQLAVPALATIERFSDDMKAKESEVNSVRARLKDKCDEKARLEQELAKLELGHAVPTEEDLAGARELRQRGWQLVLDAWEGRSAPESDVDEFLQLFPGSPSLADAYRRSVEMADQLSDQLRFDADRVATKSRIRHDMAQCDGHVKKLGEDLDAVGRELSAIQTQWMDFWEPLSIRPLSPVEMREWLHRQQKLVDVVRQLRTKRSERTQLVARIDDMAGELRRMLDSIDPGCVGGGSSFHELVRLGANKVEEIKRSQNQREKLNVDLARNREDLVGAQSRCEEAEHDLETWTANWTAEMEAIGLPSDALPSQANSVLRDIGRLVAECGNADELRIRLEGIDRDAHEFATDVTELVGRVLPGSTTDAPEDAVSLLSRRLEEARLARQKRDLLETQIEDLEGKLAAADKGIAEAKISLDEMCRKASCTDYHDLSQAAIKSRERRGLEGKVRGLEESISSQSGGVDFDTFLREVESEPLDVDAIPPRIDELEAQIGDYNSERDAVIGQIREEKIELAKIDGGSKASDLNLACEGIASRLGGEVQELARLRMASSVLHAAIEEYREKNQGPVLSRASEIFNRITLGGFVGLHTDFDERGDPVLTGVRNANDEKISVSGMSDGTCDQLYLALRLASLENWLKRHEPVPFIVDDVLLNFDDDRAIASLQVLAELSRQTQVVFFTHHQHLADIARENLPGEELFVSTLHDS